MKKQQNRINTLQKVTHFTTNALTGRLGVLMMVLSYSTFAVVLLAYVSTQVYTSSLMEDISAKKATERELKEKIGILTSQYTSLASRGRISQICEKRLGMVESDTRLVERISVRPEDADFGPRLEFTERPIDLPKVLGSDIDGITEVMRR